MSVVSPADVRMLVDTALDDEDLQVIIDREEAWLALKVGPLVGERTQSFYPSSLPDTYHATLPLRRHVGTLDDVAVEDAGSAIDNDGLRLVGEGWALRRPTYRWAGPVDITYTPDDLAAVEKAVIALVRLEVNDHGYQSEGIGAYNYSRGNSTPAQQRDSIVRSLLRPAVPGTIRVRGADRVDDLYRAN